MATDYTKAKNLLAQYQALSNAATMIGTHGEEGFKYADDNFNDAYRKATKRVEKSLMLKADKALAQYKSFGIDVNCDIDDDSGYLN